jgi:predicted dehydrogenase
MMGVRGRGGGVLSTFAALNDVEVRYVCDIDVAALASGLKRVEDKTGRKPNGIKDFRRAIDDKAVDAFVIGTPDHWHALPTIYACQAGKDVYVEKPDGHNIVEGQTMVAAAKKHRRVVQLGTQSRSGQHFLAAIDYLKSGAGKGAVCESGKAAAGSIGRLADSEPPKE